MKVGLEGIRRFKLLKETAIFDDDEDENDNENGNVPQFEKERDFPKADQKSNDFIIINGSDSEMIMP